MPLRLDEEEGVDAKKNERGAKRENGAFYVFWLESKEERGRKRSEGLREGEGELILSSSHAN